MRRKNIIKNIAIMGSSGGAGKDTVADMILEQSADMAPLEFSKISLSKGIYEICRKYGQQVQPTRYHLQSVGEVMRKIFGENVWINYLDKSIDIDSNTKKTIIPDVRKLIEFSHYVIEKKFAPLYVFTDEKTARNRLVDRDGGYNEEDLHRTIETQMNFVETLPTRNIGNNGLKKVVDSGCFNEIYIIDNSGSLQSTEKQVKDWWNLFD